MYISLRGISDPRGRRRILARSLPSPLEKRDQGNARAHARDAYAAHTPTVGRMFGLERVGGIVPMLSQLH